MADDLIAAAATCGTVLHDAGGAAWPCPGPMRIRTRDRFARLATTVLVCANPKCGTARVHKEGSCEPS